MDNADRGVAMNLFACEPMMRGPGYGDAKCRDEVYKTLVSVGYKLHGEKLAEYFPEHDILYIHIPAWRSRTALERIQAILMEANLPKVVRRQGKWYLEGKPEQLQDNQVLVFNTHVSSFKLRELEGFPQENCIWEEDSDGVWHGTCGISWVLEADTPSENEINFCPKCGKRLLPNFHVLHETNKALRGEVKK